MVKCKQLVVIFLFAIHYIQHAICQCCQLDLIPIYFIFLVFCFVYFCFSWLPIQLYSQSSTFSSTCSLSCNSHWSNAPELYLTWKSTVSYLLHPKKKHHFEMFLHSWSLHSTSLFYVGVSLFDSPRPVDILETFFTSTWPVPGKLVFGHIESVKILLILNPTGYMFTSSGIAFIFEVNSSIDSSKVVGNSPEVSSFNQLFLKLKSIHL